MQAYFGVVGVDTRGIQVKVTRDFHCIIGRPSVRIDPVVACGGNVVKGDMIFQQTNKQKIKATKQTTCQVCMAVQFYKFISRSIEPRYLSTWRLRVTGKVQSTFIVLLFSSVSRTQFFSPSLPNEYKRILDEQNKNCLHVMGMLFRARCPP